MSSRKTLLDFVLEYKMIRSKEARCKRPHCKPYDCLDIPKPPFCPVGPTGATGPTGPTGPTGSNFSETLVTATIFQETKFNLDRSRVIINWNKILDPGNNFVPTLGYKVPCDGIYDVGVVVNINADPVISSRSPYFSIVNGNTSQEYISGYLNLFPKYSQISLIQYLELKKGDLLQLYYNADGIVTDTLFSCENTTLSIKRIV